MDTTTRLADDAAVVQRIFDHIDNKTTDLGTATWREPVENYRSEARFIAERDRVLRRYPTGFCPSAALPEAGSFVARVAALVGGASGRAVLLNLVSGPAEVHPLLDPSSPVVVLVESSDPQLARCTALRPVVEAKKAPVPPAGAGAAAVGIALVPMVAMVGALALTALVVTLLVWLL